MSEPLRIAVVAEGVTDFAVIEAAISAMLSERPFVLTALQPKEVLRLRAEARRAPMGAAGRVCTGGAGRLWRAPRAS